MKSLRFFSCATILSVSLTAAARADHHSGDRGPAARAAAVEHHVSPAPHLAAQSRVFSHSPAPHWAGRDFHSNGRADRGRDHRDHDGGGHRDNHSREWWSQNHRHDRVVFIGGGYLYNPYYYGGSYGPGYYRGDYYSSRPVYQANVVDSSVAVDVQRRLRREGYYRGPIDGDVGPGTRGAIAAFQRDNGLTPNGRITGSLLEALGLS